MGDDIDGVGAHLSALLLLLLLLLSKKMRLQDGGQPSGRNGGSRFASQGGWVSGDVGELETAAIGGVRRKELQAKVGFGGALESGEREAEQKAEPHQGPAAGRREPLHSLGLGDGRRTTR
eukprot:GGOE01011561.1.p4 GENE.GGOE01011561.1~~GGOE01011561.1.p4  ORF type:complete len:120 (+),score=3.46 GGOE01011561.1:1096-1455(+)